MSDFAMKTLAKWSIDEYHRMIEAEVLRDRKVELLEGEIVEMTPETPIHYNTAKRGAKYLEELLVNQAEVRFNGPITLANSEPEPDIAIVKLPESTYNSRHPEPGDVFWVIEVAKTSLKKDLQLKAAIYANAQIQEYWIIDLSTRQIIVLRNPQDNKYTQEQIIQNGIITPLAFPNIQVSVQILLNY
ncbi:Uma2 family endonuclease [Calothrix sp. UHCC 0171]|uniref:Uma2 family endonuclease n=1 Tax=Calothrix sp. UHCC 0171 TaxID=3110245 RepID=UPI002B219B84|nr:Uma2 family endonuclease [Calothrix sp. UHCC 0171]MEA5571054.1 Uma2 family endonuclease [Calothrix sp. UHCC 0171]